jgi:hypothetical protein
MSKRAKALIRKIKNLARAGKLKEVEKIVRKNLKILKPYLPMALPTPKRKRKRKTIN